MVGDSPLLQLRPELLARIQLTLHGAMLEKRRTKNRGDASHSLRVRVIARTPLLDVPVRRTAKAVRRLQPLIPVSQLPEYRVMGYVRGKIVG